LARLLLISGASLVRLWVFLSVFVCERIAVFLGVWGTWRASYAHCEDTDTEPVSVPYEICNIKLISQASDSDVGNSPTQRYRYRYGYYFLCWWWCERALSVRV